MKINDTRRRILFAATIAPATGTILSAPGSNPVQIENAATGTPNWEISKWAHYFDWQAGTLGVDPYPEVEGYASASSVNLGGTFSIFVNCAEASFTIQIFRLGWYNGAGARLLQSNVVAGQRQVLPTPNALGTVDCAWVNPYVLSVPTSWTSGIYLAKLIAASGAQSFVPFVVRDDSSRSEFLFQCASNTAQAYNNWGGKSLYEFNSRDDKAVAVSFNRPDADGGGAGQILHWELQMMRFLEREGYDVSYTSNVDVHANPALLLNHKAFLSVGHDEYWSYQMKQAVQVAQASGIHVGFFSANTAYWQVRFSSDNRVMTSYKELAYRDPFTTDGDQTNNKFITDQWRNVPSYGVVDAIARPENAMIGVMYHKDPVNADLVVFDPTHWVFANTGVVKGTKFVGLLGYETDSMYNNGFQPAGIRKLCESPDGGGEFSHATCFVAPSGSTTFASGTMQWSWGLDFHTSWAPNAGTNRVNAAVQQATRNILERFRLPALVAPTNLAATISSGQVVLTWSSVTGAVSYDVYRSLIAGDQGIVPYRVGLSSPALADTGLTNGTRYYYRVVARTGAAESLPSAELVAIPAGAALPPQTIAFSALTAKTVGDAPFALAATASSGLPVTFSSLTPAVATVSGNMVTIIAAGTATIAANQAGNAQYAAAPQVTQSFTIAAKQGGTVQPPTKLTGYFCGVGCWAYAQQGNISGIRINWTQSNSQGIVTNTVYRGNGTTGALAPIATIPAGIFYFDTNVVAGQVYHYRITATNSAGVTSAMGNDTALSA